MNTKYSDLRKIVIDWGPMLEIFRVLKWEGYIQSYHIMTLAQNISFNITIVDSLKLNFTFTKKKQNSLFSGDYKVLSSNNKRIFSILGDYDIEEVYLGTKRIILGFASEYLKGISTENEFLRRSIRAIVNDERFHRVEHGTSEEDIGGVDFWIFFNQLRIPLQIKSSRYFQKKHMEKYPKIPSLVYKKGLNSDEWVLDRLILICLSYEEGVVRHL